MKEKRIRESLVIKQGSVFFLFLGVIALVYWPTVTSRYLLVTGDGLMYYLSKVFWVDSIREGEFPLWNPFSLIGTPFLADTQQTALSPFNLLYLLFDTTLAFNLTHVICLVMAGYFMYLLMYQLTKKNICSIVTGMLFVFSTMLGGHRIEHVTIITTICFFSPILWSMEKFRASKNGKWLILTAIIMAMQFLSGFTQIVLYFDIVVFIRMLYILREARYSIKEGVFLCLKWILLYILLISCQLLPTAQLIMSSGRNEIPWESFSAYGYDLRILLLMLFPTIYFNEFESFGIYASSGIDIEIYIGAICLVYIVYEMLYCRKESGVKFWGVLAGGVFMYGMAPNIPLLGKVIYSIPILNSFRVCARSLPIFIFLEIVITGMGLAHLWDVEKRKDIIKVNKYLVVFVLLIFVFWSCVSSQQIFQSDYADYYRKMREGIAIALGMLTIHLILLYFLEWVRRKECRRIRGYETGLVCSIIGVLVVVDIMRFSVLYSEQMNPCTVVLNNGISDEIQELVDEDTREGYRTFAIISNQDIFYSSDLLNIAKYGRAIYSHNNIYNAWLTFLDKKLDYWGIKENVFYPYFTEKLISFPQLGAMLGIHYILSDLDVDYNRNIKIIDEMVDKEIILEDNLAEFKESTGLIYYITLADWLEANTSYLVTLRADITNCENLYADFYNDSYDNVEQDGKFTQYTDSKGTLYKTIITTEEIPEDDVYFRILASDDNTFRNAELEIQKVGLEKTNIYEKVSVADNEIFVYASNIAKKIIYVSEETKGIIGYGNSWQEDGLYDIDKVSYVSDFDGKIDSGSNSIITEISQKRNSVSAVIQTDVDTFVNHAQLAYPGWKAYVDGKRVKLYTVNNLIQGAMVPAGEHIIEFRYEPDDLKLGCALSMIGIIFACFWWGRSNQRQQNAE